MAVKNDIVISHIESLDVGTKISVRGLSAYLGVSEGTAYKAIKEAETCGLVMTKPKTGTFRIDSEISTETHETSLSQITKILGLTVLAGVQSIDKTIKNILVGDSDEDNLKRSISEKDEPGSILCIVGNRPDIEETVIQAGAHLLITGGSRPEENLIITAEKNGVCILASLQSTHTLMHLFYNQLPMKTVTGTDGMAQDWMQVPQHLYINDIAADWQRLYRWIPAIASQYPVVNDDLEICGALDIAKAFAANPSQKISGVLTAPFDYLQIGPCEPMQDIAEKMILTGKNFAAVTQAGKMNGLITANDILRYYLFSGRSGSRYKYESFLEETADGSSKEQKVFTIHYPKDELDNFSEFSVSIMLAAAKQHAEAIFKKPCRLDNGTFFSINPSMTKDDLLLSSIVSRFGDNYCAFEVEMHDETKSYTKSILMFSCA